MRHLNYTAEELANELTSNWPFPLTQEIRAAAADELIALKQANMDCIMHFETLMQDYVRLQNIVKRAIPAMEGAVNQLEIDEIYAKSAGANGLHQMDAARLLKIAMNNLTGALNV